MRYVDGLDTIPNTDADNALILGTALHTGIEEGVEQALDFYKNSFPVLTDDHIHEMMKLEAMIPKAKAMLPPGGTFELPIGNADFIGFMDYLVPVGKGLKLDGLITGEDLDEFEAFDLYDFKYSNNAKNYAVSGQLHEYKYWYELTHPGHRIRNMYFLIVPKPKIRQKSTETLHWHFRRLKEQLHWHFRRYGREGAVLLLDLKGFFPNAPHALLYQRHQEFISNPDLRALADMVIQTSPCPIPGRGLPLGVEPSQQEMVAMPSAIDNWIKCQAGVHCFGHYMDDYYLILPDVEALKKLGHEIVRRFEAAGIRVNKRKCKIIPLTKPFRFCKARFTLTETGKIKVNGSRDGVKRARRKLKLFHREFVEGKRLFSDIEQYMECQSAYYRNFNDHGRLLRLRRLYHAIFFGGAKCSESSKMGQALA